MKKISIDLLRTGKGHSLGTTWEETSFQNTQNNTKTYELVPALNEAEALKNISIPKLTKVTFTYDHSDSPQDSDTRQENLWSDLAKQDGGRWLKEDIRNEEYSTDDIILESIEIQTARTSTHTRQCQ